MSSDPKWLRDLDVARYRATEEAGRAAVWARWAIGQLPAKLRSKAAAAWKNGKLPIDIAEPPAAEDDK